MRYATDFVLPLCALLLYMLVLPGCDSSGDEPEFSFVGDWEGPVYREDFGQPKQVTNVAIDVKMSLSTLRVATKDTLIYVEGSALVTRTVDGREEREETMDVRGYYTPNDSPVSGRISGIYLDFFTGSYPESMADDDAIEFVGRLTDAGKSMTGRMTADARGWGGRRYRFVDEDAEKPVL